MQTSQFVGSIVQWGASCAKSRITCRASAERDLARRDALLDELRQLSERHGQDAAVRERLAKGLFNTLNHAKDERDLARRDALLAELRQLSERHGEDAAVRKRLAKGLGFTWRWLSEEGEPAEREAVLVELRKLLERHADDERLGEVRAWLDEQTGQ